MPSRPVLIGRGLVPTPYKTHTRPYHPRAYVTNTSHTKLASRPLSSSQPTHPTPTHTHIQGLGGEADVYEVERVTAAIAKRETPGPIPNPEVKPFSADGTATERLWESRTPPDIHWAEATRYLVASASFHAHGEYRGARHGAEASRREVRLWPRTVEDSVRHEVAPAAPADGAARPEAGAALRRAVARRAPAAATPAAATPAVTLAVATPAVTREPRSPRRQPWRLVRAWWLPGRQGHGQGGKPAGAPQRGFRGRAEEKPRTASQAEYDGPDLPEDVTGAELDRGVRAQLKGLPEKLAARVARHLAAAGAADRRGPRDGLPAHAGCARPRVAPGCRARGDR